MNYIYKIISCLLLFAYQFNAVSQTSLTKIGNVEQIRITTDRNLYLSGETVWFTAIYSVPDNQELSLSSVLYVDVFDNEKKLVKKQKFRITNGIVKGNIVLPEQSLTGYYILRAYTRYQSGFPVWQMSSVILSVVNPYHPIPNDELNPMGSITIGISKEGNTNYCIEKPLSHIVKKVNLISEGNLVDTNTVYYANGLGKSSFIPDAHNSLRLQIILSNGDTIHSDDQKMEIQDFRVSSIITNDEIEFDIVGEPEKDCSLILSLYNIGSRTYANNPIRFRNNTGLSIFKRIKKLSGLNLLSIISSNHDTILQTFVSIPINQKSTKNSIPETNRIDFEDSVLIDLSQFKSEYYPISISATYESTNTCSNILLPEFLIKNSQFASDFIISNDVVSDEILEQMEISASLFGSHMIDEINANRNAVSYVVPEVYGLTVQGVLCKKGDIPVSDKKVFCSVLGNNPQFHVALTNEDGRFVIPLNPFNGNKDIYLASDINEDDFEKIDIETGFCPSPPIWNPVSYIPDTSMRKLLTNMYISYQVNEMYKVKRREIVYREYSKLTLFAGNLKEVQMIDYVQMANTQELINEIVPYVKVRKKSDNYYFNILDAGFNTQYSDPLVLLDNIYFSDVNQIMKFQPTEIKSVGVINKTYAYGNFVFNGIICINSSAGNLEGISFPNSGVFFDLDSESEEASFMQFSDLPHNQSKPDYANTLLWKVFDKEPHVEKAKVWIKKPNNHGSFEVVIKSLNCSEVIERKILFVK